MDSPVVYGIDPSSRKLAVVALRYPDTHESEMMTTIVLDQGPDGVSQAYQALSKLIEPYSYVVVEAPVLVKGAVQSLLVQAYVNGAIQAACVDAGTTVGLVPPSQWKKEIVGNGGAGKPAVAEWLGRVRPGLAERAGGDQDLTDASCIALYGAALCEWGVGLAGPGSVQGSEPPVLLQSG